MPNKPGEALRADEAFEFHLPQLEALADSPIDFLYASTLPAVSEAAGIARAMATTGLPYVLSFVIRADGTILDGVPLREAIDRLDNELAIAPAGYYVNCVHPTMMRGVVRSLPPGRLIGLQGNTSRRSPEEIDGSPELDGQAPAEFARDMMAVVGPAGIKIAGGCCGTDASHMEALASELARTRASRDTAGR